MALVQMKYAVQAVNAQRLLDQVRGRAALDVQLAASAGTDFRRRLASPLSVPMGVFVYFLQAFERCLGIFSPVL